MANRSIALVVEPKGIPEVLEALRDVRRSVAARILKSGMDYAIKPLTPAVAMAVPTQFGTLKRSITSRVKKYTRGDLSSAVVVGVVGPGSKYQETVAKPNVFSFKLQSVVSKPSKYAHLIERGVKPHAVPFPGFGRKAKKSRATLNTKRHTFQHPGFSARPFIRPTADTNHATVIQRFAQQVHTRVKVEWAKAVKKGSKFWASDT